jgi:hypothetical protein
VTEAPVALVTEALVALVTEGPMMEGPMTEVSVVAPMTEGPVMEVTVTKTPRAVVTTAAAAA